MNLVKKFEKNVINSRNETGRELSTDELSPGWLSHDLDDSISGESSSPESIYEDFYFRTRNYCTRRNSHSRKAMLDRVYDFIYDEIFPSETTTESDFTVDNYSPRNDRAKNLVAGDGEDLCAEKFNDRFREDYMKMRLRGGVEMSNSEEAREVQGVRIQRNRTWNLENQKSQSSPRIFTKKIQNCEEILSQNRNTSRFQSAENCAQSVSDSSDFLSEISNFKEPFGNLQSRKFISKKSSVRRKRKFTSTEFRDRFNYSENYARRKNSEIYEAEDPVIRISKSSRLVSKMRRIYSEQILIEKLRGKNNEPLFYEAENSSSDESFVIDVEEILQENLRGKKNRFNVETILLENKTENFSKFLESFTKPGRISESLTSETHETEMKLLEDIKKRIDDDFECDLSVIKGAGSSNESSKPSETRKTYLNIDSKEFSKVVSTSGSNCSLENFEKERNSKRIDRKSLSLDKVFGSNVTGSEISYSINTSSKSSRQYLVDSIDSGVSTDFSRNESDLSRNDHCFKTDTKVIENSATQGKGENFLAIARSSNHSDADDEEVEKAVQKFTEELIMCERRAKGRGLAGVENRKRKIAAAGKRKKSSRQIRYSSPAKSSNTFISPREFPKTSQSSSEEEYLENISPPSLCSISDSDVENLSDFYD